MNTLIEIKTSEPEPQSDPLVLKEICAKGKRRAKERKAERHRRRKEKARLEEQKEALAWKVLVDEFEAWPNHIGFSKDLADEDDQAGYFCSFEGKKRLQSMGLTITVTFVGNTRLWRIVEIESDSDDSSSDSDNDSDSESDSDSD